jgi:glycosyltransferase involved in cell wall biosynthesis
MNGGPRMSVVIPARDAERTIGRAVAGALAQEVDGGHEVIVVDDGSRDATSELAEREGAKVIRNFVAVGPARARNRGVAAARGELLAFTDADCEPAPGWLAAGSRALEGADIVQGRVEPPPGQTPGPFDHVIAVDRASGLFETANLLVRREWFDRVGGFRAFIDPAQGHFGEDVVFGWEARRAGARAAFADDAVVRHAIVRRGAGEWLRERARLRLFPALTREVPELREHYALGVFLSARTARFDLAVAGLVGAAVTRRAWPALLAAPYAAMLARADPRHAPALALGDAAGLAALVAGSAEARTAVL